MAIHATTVEDMYGQLHVKLAKVVPDYELRRKAELAVQINELKKQRHAIILGHNYMEPALFQSVADFTGDSLELCRRAAETDADIIVFCGVKFMAESAKIINPDKTVLLPSLEAGCSLAGSITRADVRHLRERLPGVPVVSYINTYADVKAETDVCCTSGNAAKVVESFPGGPVFFLPDEYLARNVAHDMSREILFPEQYLEGDLSPHDLGNALLGWHGKCEVHELFTPQDVHDVRKQFDDVVVLAHPECPPEVIAEADFSGSTSAMIRHVKEATTGRFLLLTECSMGDNVIAENPGKDILRLCSHRCPHMNQITLEDTLEALQKQQFVIDVPEPVRTQARRSIERMLEIG
jgi:quinolinate synthase